MALERTDLHFRHDIPSLSLVNVLLWLLVCFATPVKIYCEIFRVLHPYDFILILVRENEDFFFG